MQSSPAYTVEPATIVTSIYGLNGVSTGNNFTIDPTNNRVVSGTVFMPGPTCPGVSNATNVTVSMFGPNYSYYTTSAYVSGSGAQISGHSFRGLPAGAYTVFINGTADYTAGGPLNTTSVLWSEYDQNMSVSPKTFNICGTVLGDSTPGPVYLFVGGTSFIKSTTVNNGTFVFQHVPPNIYGVFMVNPSDGSYTYSPAWPQYQTVWMANWDYRLLYLSSKLNSFDVTGQFNGLSTVGGMSVFLRGTSTVGTKISMTSSAMQNFGFVFHKVPNGSYVVQTGAPPINAQVVPTFLPVTVDGANAFAGAFNLVQSGRGAITGRAFTVGRIPVNSGTVLADPQLVISSNEYIGDTFNLSLGGIGGMLGHASNNPLRISTQLHPGSYNFQIVRHRHIRSPRRAETLP